MTTSHSASHLLYVAIKKIRNDAIAGIIGCHIKEAQARFDFRVDRRFSEKEIKKKDIKLITKMWKKVGMKVDVMDADHHDLVLAITSHIPHIIAYSIVGTVADLEFSIKKEVIKYAASGFRDFTRIAASDPTMWRDIALLNKSSIIKALELFKKDLSTLEQAIKSDDGEFLYNLFSKTRKIRKDIT